MGFTRNLRRRIERLGPYPSLILMALPLVTVEPLKLATVFIVGSGHWVTGTIALICTYTVSILVVERLFKIVKPKLLTLPWFAVCWRWFVAARRRVAAWLWSLWLRARDAWGSNVHPRGHRIIASHRGTRPARPPG